MLKHRHPYANEMEEDAVHSTIYLFMHFYFYNSPYRPIKGQCGCHLGISKFLSRCYYFVGALLE